MRYAMIVLLMVFCLATPVSAEINVNIGFNVPGYPELVRVPDYPVYYSPRLPGNYFFYDGLFWVFERDNWYASSWYNGPWRVVGPEFVPLYVLRVPVRYYRHPPHYFHGWRRDAPPRWGEHWGRDWEQRRAGWDRWDRRSAPKPAPLPVYQRKYTQDRYPQAEQQHALHSQNYRYQPREDVVRQHYQQQRTEAPPAPARVEHEKKGPRPEAAQRPAPSPPPQTGKDERPRQQQRDADRAQQKSVQTPPPPPVQHQAPPPPEKAAPREPPKAAPAKGAPHESKGKDEFKKGGPEKKGEERNK